jgi:hypothetical protein
MVEKMKRYQPTFILNDTDKTIRIPWPSNLSDQNAFGNHLGNIQWMAQGFGGTLNADQTEWLFKFDPEEYNCVVRYLSRPEFSWVKERIYEHSYS